MQPVGKDSILKVSIFANDSQDCEFHDAILRRRPIVMLTNIPLCR